MEVSLLNHNVMVSLVPCHFITAWKTFVFQAILLSEEFSLFQKVVGSEVVSKLLFLHHDELMTERSSQFLRQQPVSFCSSHYNDT